MLWQVLSGMAFRMAGDMLVLIRGLFPPLLRLIIFTTTLFPRILTRLNGK